ncbi:MAG: ADP-ribosylglycohydrolase family protein [Candidatus Cryosericum sp.]
MMTRKAWELERDMRQSAVPVDRRVNPSSWSQQTGGSLGQDEMMCMLWRSRVPGSGAPECLYLEAAQSMENQGYDESAAVSLIPLALKALDEQDTPRLRVLTGHYLSALFNAPRDRDFPYVTYARPESWEDVSRSLPDTSLHTPEPARAPDEQTLSGWIGQLAGGAFGTAIEGYTGDRIAQVYGDVRSYVTAPETMNDDVVYELALLDACKAHGRDVSSVDIADEWLRQIPFGWSAEWIALQNLRAGIMPPASGTYRNPFSDWIGVQMRAMVCGMLTPARPMEAARLAYLDGIVSHSAGGVYGGMYAAALTALAYVRDDPRELLREALSCVPQGTEYSAIVRECLEIMSHETSPDGPLAWLKSRFEQYNWIHAYPNIAADMLALWYGERDMTQSFSLLAKCGLDVDCNAGLVGNILGIMGDVPSSWAEPIGDRLETYIPGKERLSIRTLAESTSAISRLLVS